MESHRDAHRKYNREARKQAYHDNPEHFRKIAREYRARNLEKCNTLANKWKKENPDKARFSIEKYRRENRDHLLIYGTTRHLAESIGCDIRYVPIELVIAK